MTKDRDLIVDPDTLRDLAGRLTRTYDDLTTNTCATPENFREQANLDQMSGGKPGFGDRSASPTVDMVTQYYNSIFTTVSTQYGTMLSTVQRLTDAMRDVAKNWEDSDGATTQSVDDLDQQMDGGPPVSPVRTTPTPSSRGTQPTDYAESTGQVQTDADRF